MKSLPRLHSVLWAKNNLNLGIKSKPVTAGAKTSGFWAHESGPETVAHCPNPDRLSFCANKICYLKTSQIRTFLFDLMLSICTWVASPMALLPHSSSPILRIKRFFYSLNKFMFCWFRVKNLGGDTYKKRPKIIITNI